MHLISTKTKKPADSDLVAKRILPSILTLLLKILKFSGVVPKDSLKSLMPLLQEAKHDISVWPSRDLWTQRFLHHIIDEDPINALNSNLTIYYFTESKYTPTAQADDQLVSLKKLLGYLYNFKQIENCPVDQKTVLPPLQ